MWVLWLRVHLEDHFGETSESKQASFKYKNNWTERYTFITLDDFSNYIGLSLGLRFYTY
jgi:hypothetical protein